MEFQALYYDGRTSARQPVRVRFVDGACLQIEALGSRSRFGLESVKVSPRLGQQPAIVDLPDGGRLEIADAAGFYAELAACGRRRQWVHALESRWSWVLVALLATLGLVWLLYAVGIPAAARTAAAAIPDEVDRALGSEGLQLLDAQLFAPSELPPERQAELAAVFDDVQRAVRTGLDTRLVLRKGQAVGANAFALPSGLVVLTDELVALARHDEELAAVLAHEIGHVRERHSLRALLQNSVVALGIALLTGDIASTSSVVTGLPTLLAFAGYSREFEYEADAVAREYLQVRGLPARRFTELMLRLEADSPDLPDGLGLLRTHQATAERMRAFTGAGTADD
ncbi:MAG: M48 family metallopeptidase [Gammaproteobacteria bacterium]|jgi:Zn-dependent protease with chaperone function|nr:M48 family metallopeptidase [Gammaproteobacteria bacterium]